MLNSTAGLSLGILFVAIAGTNSWLMLRASRSSLGANSRTRLVRLHRLGGYLFIALFSVMFFYMNLRVLGVKRGLPIGITLHSALAFLLLPLLLVKVLIARYYRQHSGALLAIGLTIFIVSFLLVSLTSFPILWAAVENVPSGVGIGVMVLAVIIFAALFLRRPLASPAAVANPQLDAPAEKSLKLAAKKSLILLLSRIQAQTHNAKTLRFILPQGNGFHPRPGQFLTFNWIVDGKALARSYSISSSPLQKGYVEITAKQNESGCVSAFLNRSARVGLTVEAHGPSGQFCFDERQHGKIALIAGGSGITPMMAMLRYIDDLGLTTDVTLLYFVKTRHDIIFATELAQLRASIRNFRYVVVASTPDAEWQGPTGHLSGDLLESTVGALYSTSFFLCGPRGLMESARNLLRELGVPNDKILQESFGGKPEPSLPSSTNNPTGTLDFARSHKRCPILEGRTLLEVAESNDVFIPSSCRQGQCGTCAVRLLKGAVQMDTEEGLSADLKQRGYVLTCVGRGQGSVSLDV